VLDKKGRDYRMKSTVKKVVVTSALMFISAGVVNSTVYVSNVNAQTSSPALTMNADHVQSSNKSIEKAFLENLNELLDMDTQGIYNEKAVDAFQEELEAFEKKFEQEHDLTTREPSEKEIKEFLESVAKISVKHEIYNQEELSKYANAWIEKLVPFKGELDGVADELIELFEGFRDGTYDKGELFSIHEQVINHKFLREKFQLGDDLKFYMNEDNKAAVK
jgi:hypothetical protein